MERESILQYVFDFPYIYITFYFHLTLWVNKRHPSHHSLLRNSSDRAKGYSLLEQYMCVENSGHCFKGPTNSVTKIVLLLHFVTLLFWNCLLISFNYILFSIDKVRFCLIRFNIKFNNIIFCIFLLYIMKIFHNSINRLNIEKK